MNPWISTESNSVCLSIIYFILLHPSLYHSEATPSILPLLQHDKTTPRPCWDDYLEHSLPSSFRLHFCWTPFPWERPFKRRCWMTLWGEANKFPFASDKTSTTDHRNNSFQVKLNTPMSLSEPRWLQGHCMVLWTSCILRLDPAQIAGSTSGELPLSQQ